MEALSYLVLCSRTASSFFIVMEGRSGSAMLDYACGIQHIAVLCTLASKPS